MDLPMPFLPHGGPCRRPGIPLPKVSEPPQRPLPPLPEKFAECRDRLFREAAGGAMGLPMPSLPHGGPCRRPGIPPPKVPEPLQWALPLLLEKFAEYRDQLVREAADLVFARSPVLSVSGRTGDVVLNAADVGLGNVDNTADADKPISTATQNALDGKQPVIQDLADIRSGAAAGATALQSGDILSGGLVKPSLLPSYVDDVVEGYLYNGAFYEDAAHTTQITPSTGKIYVDLTSEKAYRWSGSVYVEISQGTIITRTTGTIGTSATSATVSYSGTLINAYATQGGAEILLDIAYGSGTVTFTVAAAPSAEITCVVISC